MLKRGTRQVVNRASTALRLAAWGLLRSQSALGAKFRRLRSRLGAPKAITAMAHLLARQIYRMLRFGHEYVDKGMEYYETKYRKQQLQWVAKQAAALNMQLIPMAQHHAHDPAFGLFQDQRRELRKHVVALRHRSIARHSVDSERREPEASSRSNDIENVGRSLGATGRLRYEQRVSCAAEFVSPVLKLEVDVR